MDEAEESNEEESNESNEINKQMLRMAGLVHDHAMFANRQFLDSP